MPAVKTLDKDAWSGQALRLRLRQDGWRYRVPARGREVWSHPQHVELVHLPEDIDCPVSPVALRAIYRIAGWDPAELEGRPAVVSPDPKLKGVFNAVKVSPAKPTQAPVATMERMPKVVTAPKSPPPRPEAYQPERVGQDAWYKIEPPVARPLTDDDILEVVLHAQEHGNYAAWHTYKERFPTVTLELVGRWRADLEKAPTPQQIPEQAVPAVPPQATQEEHPVTQPTPFDPKRYSGNPDRFAACILSRRYATMAEVSHALALSQSYYSYLKKNSSKINDAGLRKAFDAFSHEFDLRPNEGPYAKALFKDSGPQPPPPAPVPPLAPTPQPQEPEMAPHPSEKITMHPSAEASPEEARSGSMLVKENAELRAQLAALREDNARMQAVLAQMTIERYEQRRAAPPPPHAAS